MANLIIGLCILNLIGIGVYNILNEQKDETPTPTPTPTPSPVPTMSSVRRTALDNEISVPAECQGDWNDILEWSVHTACNANCNTLSGQKVMQKTFIIPPGADPELCTNKNGDIELVPMSCDVEPENCACEGDWNDAVNWTVYTPCNADCSTPNGQKVMQKTFVIPPGSNPDWCTIPNGQTELVPVPCNVGPADCPCEGDWNDAVGRCTPPRIVGQKVMQKTFVIPPGSNPDWCTIPNGQIELVPVPIGPADCPCEGDWNDAVNWTVYPCNADCSTPNGQKVMQKTFVIPPGSNPDWCTIPNGQIELVPVPCNVGPADCPCEGDWNDAVNWTVYSPCNADCSTPNGQKVMQKTFVIPPGSNPDWCTIPNGQTRTCTYRLLYRPSKLLVIRR